MDKLNFSKDILNVLACPVCGQTLEKSENGKELKCSKCGANYEIRNGIPMLFPDDDMII